jgi:hypothetical protein
MLIFIHVLQSEDFVHHENNTSHINPGKVFVQIQKLSSRDVFVSFIYMYVASTI